MERDLREKLNGETPLSVEEMLKLDEALGQSDGMRRLTQDLPEDEPSLAWRSQLNERLSAMQPAPVRPKRLWWPYAASAAAAAVAAIAIFAPWHTTAAPQEPTNYVQNSAPVEKSDSVEELMLRAHTDAEATVILGVSAPVTEANSQTPEVYDWSRLESL